MAIGEHVDNVIVGKKGIACKLAIEFSRNRETSQQVFAFTKFGNVHNAHVIGNEMHSAHSNNNLYPLKDWHGDMLNAH